MASDIGYSVQGFEGSQLYGVRMVVTYCSGNRGTGKSALLAFTLPQAKNQRLSTGQASRQAVDPKP